MFNGMLRKKEVGMLTPHVVFEFLMIPPERTNADAPTNSLKKRPDISPRRSHIRSLFVTQLSALPDHETQTVRENFLTACFAGALCASPALARRVVRRLVGSDTWRRVRISSATVGVHAQVRYNSFGRSTDTRVIDLLLELNKTYRVGLEIKLEAGQSKHVSGRSQLNRYLDIKDLDAVAFLTKDVENLDEKTVLKHAGARYLVPQSTSGGLIRPHFLWGDFYDDVCTAAAGRHPSPVASAMLGLMDYLQLQPIHRHVRELGGRASARDVTPEVRGNRKRMHDAMLLAMSSLSEARWTMTKTGPRENGTLYAWREGRNHVPNFKDLWVSTNLTPGALRIYFAFESEITADRFYDVIRTALPEALRTAFRRDIMPSVHRVRGAQYAAVDCRLPLSRLLQGVRADREVGQPLATGVNVAAATALDAMTRRQKRTV
jgi:hypothetical protein